MSILSHHIIGVSMDVHGMHHCCIRTKHADMNGLTMLHQNRLCIRKTLTIDRVITARHGTDKLGIFGISVNCLLRLGGARTRIYNESSVHTTSYLFQVIVVTVIPMASDILIMYYEVINICLA